jgi:hypothetical protein
MLKRLSAALLFGGLLASLIPTAAQAAPARPADTAGSGSQPTRAQSFFDDRGNDHRQCMYRCEDRGYRTTNHDRDRYDRDRDDRRRYDRRRYDRCRYGRCSDRAYHDGSCWYHDGDRWRRCRSRYRYYDRYNHWDSRYGGYDSHRQHERL